MEEEAPSRSPRPPRVEFSPRLSQEQEVVSFDESPHSPRDRRRSKASVESSPAGKSFVSESRQSYVSEKSRLSEEESSSLHRKSLTETASILIRAHSDESVRGLLDSTVGRHAKDIHEQKTVGKENVLAYIREEHRRRVACCHLPMVIMYFVVFACVVLAHEDLKNTAQMRRMAANLAEGAGYAGIPDGTEIFMAHKDFTDVDSVGDAWEYLDGDLLGLFLPVLGEVEPRDMNRVKRQNRLFGGLQLQQQRRREEACTKAYPNLGPYSKLTSRNPLLEGIQCYPWNQYSSECMSRGAGVEGFCPQRLEPSGRRLSAGLSDALEGARRLWGPSHVQKARSPLFKDGLYTVMLEQHEGWAAAKARVQELQRLEWLDTATAWLGVKAFMLNPGTAVYAHLVINLWFSPSGQVIPHLQVTVFPAEPYSSKTMLAGDALLAVLWFHILARCIGGLVHAVFFRRVKEYLLTFWTWTEWFSMLGGVLVGVGWFWFLSSLGRVKNIGMDMALHQPRHQDGFKFVSSVQEATYKRSTALLHAELTDLTEILQLYRIYICWYTIFLIVRFFEAFGAQPRLAIVTNVIARSFVDFGHFLVVLCFVFLTFAVAGVLLFGHRTLEFSSLLIAMHQCFMIMLGDFDYTHLAEEHPITAGIWFFMYSISVSIILLNMALAIIMDVHAEVCADSAESDTIYTQVRGLAVYLCKYRNWYSSRAIEEKVLELDVDDISQDTLTEALPRMPPEQAEDLMAKVEDMEVQEESKGYSLSDATKLTVHIQRDVDDIASRLEVVIETQEEAEAALADLMQEHHIGERPVRYVSLQGDADHRLHVIEKRLLQMQEQLSDTMRTTVGRAKEMRHTVTVVEGLARGAAESQDLGISM